jgi:hypothetical protein
MIQLHLYGYPPVTRALRPELPHWGQVSLAGRTVSRTYANRPAAPDAFGHLLQRVARAWPWVANADPRNCFNPVHIYSRDDLFNKRKGRNGTALKSRQKRSGNEKVNLASIFRDLGWVA